MPADKQSSWTAWSGLGPATLKTITRGGAGLPFTTEPLRSLSRTWRGCMHRQAVGQPSTQHSYSSFPPAHKPNEQILQVAPEPRARAPQDLDLLSRRGQGRRARAQVQQEAPLRCGAGGGGGPAATHLMPALRPPWHSGRGHPGADPHAAGMPLGKPRRAHPQAVPR